ncbi:MAG: hypothetical protein E6713_06115 [Sporomusaceae bacterium]|nr:hypothetical protein [Sporomusaceae bacterium]
MIEIIKTDEIYKYHLCDICKNTDDPDDEAIYVCKECGKQICNCCVVNLEVGETIPCDYNNIIEAKYCPLCAKGDGSGE